MAGAAAALLEQNRGARERLTSSWGPAGRLQGGFLLRVDSSIGSGLDFGDWKVALSPAKVPFQGDSTAILLEVLWNR